MDLDKLEKVQREKMQVSRKTMTKLIKELNSQNITLPQYLMDDEVIKSVNKIVQPTVSDLIVLQHLRLTQKAETDTIKLSAIKSWYEMSGETPAKNINIATNNPYSNFSDEDLDAMISLLKGDNK